MRMLRRHHPTEPAVDERIPTGARLRCPHGIDHPSWCPTCRLHWQERMRHPSWPRREER